MDDSKPKRPTLVRAGLERQPWRRHPLSRRELRRADVRAMVIRGTRPTRFKAFELRQLRKLVYGALIQRELEEAANV